MALALPIIVTSSGIVAGIMACGLAAAGCGAGPSAGAERGAGAQRPGEAPASLSARTTEARAVPAPAAPVRWALTGGGAACDEAEDLAVGADGTTIAVGQFHETLPLGDEDLRSAGATDVFIVAVDADGRVRWARSFGGDDYDLAIAVAISSAGEAYVLGSVTGEVRLGERVLGRPGRQTSFLLALDPAGEVEWVQGFGASVWDLGWDVTVDSDDRPIVVGAFRGRLQIGARVLESRGEADGYVAAFGRDGQLAWAVGLGGAGWAHPAAVAVDAGDDVYVTGAFSGTLEVGRDVLESAGASDAFVVRLGRDGTPRWGRRFGGPGADAARGMSIVEHVVYLGGEFSGAIELGGARLESAGQRDGFVARLSGEGEPIWARAIGGAGDDDVRALVAREEGLVAAVRFGEPLDLDGRTFLAARPSDLLLVHLGDDGAARGAAQVPGAGPMLASRGIALGPDQRLRAAGAYAGSADFGAGMQEASGTCDLFVVGFESVGTAPLR